MNAEPADALTPLSPALPIRRLIGLFLSLAASSAVAQLYAKPVTTPDVSYQMDGYAVAAPPGAGWFEMRRTRDFLYFGKRLSSPTHSFIAVALSAPAGGPYADVGAFRLHIVSQITENSADQRNKVALAAAEVDPASGPFCVRYQTLSEDRGAVGTRGQSLLTETFGVSCLHPEHNELAIDVSYTERGLPAETGTTLRDEGERFVRSLKFTARP